MDPLTVDAASNDLVKLAFLLALRLALAPLVALLANEATTEPLVRYEEEMTSTECLLVSVLLSDEAFDSLSSSWSEVFCCFFKRPGWNLR